MTPEKIKALKEQFQRLNSIQQQHALEGLRLLEDYKVIEPASHRYEPLVRTH